MAGFIDVPRLNFAWVFPYTCTAGATPDSRPWRYGGEPSDDDPQTGGQAYKSADRG
jgi:hypothetical protein